MSVGFQVLGRDVTVQEADAAIGDLVEGAGFVVVGDEPMFPEVRNRLRGRGSREARIRRYRKRRRYDVLAAIVQKFEDRHMRAMHPTGAFSNGHVNGPIQRHGIKMCSRLHFNVQYCVFMRYCGPLELSVRNLLVTVGFVEMGNNPSWQVGVGKNGGGIVVTSPRESARRPQRCETRRGIERTINSLVRGNNMTHRKIRNGTETEQNYE